MSKVRVENLVRRIEDEAHACDLALRHNSRSALCRAARSLRELVDELDALALISLDENCQPLKAPLSATVSTCADCGAEYPRTNLDDGLCIGCSLRRAYGCQAVAA